MVMSLRGRGLVGLALLTVAAAASCSPAGTPSAFSMSPASAGADVVFDTYLRALVAGDCADGRRLTTPTFVKGNGELCGDARVSDYKINPEPGGGGTEEVYATTLTTTSAHSALSRSIIDGIAVMLRRTDVRFYGSGSAGRSSWVVVARQTPSASWAPCSSPMAPESFRDRAGPMLVTVG